MGHLVKREMAETYVVGSYLSSTRTQFSNRVSGFVIFWNSNSTGSSKYDQVEKWIRTQPENGNNK